MLKKRTPTIATSPTAHIELERVFTEMRAELKRLVQARLDRRLLGRVDASDIVQDAYVVAFRRYGEYLRRPEVPLCDWLRFLTTQEVMGAHRQHLQAEKRTVRKEAAMPGTLSADVIVERLIGAAPSPISAAIRAELQNSVSNLIATLSDLDREILRLRHQEQLNNQECADRLGISERAASKRYVRALRKLQQLAEKVGL